MKKRKFRLIILVKIAELTLLTQINLFANCMIKFQEEICFFAELAVQNYLISSELG